ncbi:MAG: hypothetical protein ACI4ED_02025 [Suilimivivens sp.]
MKNNLRRDRGMLGEKETVKSLGKDLIKIILILVSGILLGFAALCLVHLLPVERMHQKVLEGKDAINAHAQTIPGYVSTSIDNYTDSIMLNEAICPVDAPLLERVIYNYQVNYYRQYDQQENLLRYLDGEEGYGYQGYTHYWGGHQVILKLLLLVFDYADILAINMILQTLLVVFVAVGLYKSGKEKIILPFMISLISVMPMTIAVCLQFCDVYYILLAGSALIVWQYDRIKKERMYILFLISGMCTSYFDFLTYPLASLGIPLVLFLVFLDKETLKKKLFYMIQCSITWCIGYVGMWSGKWILGSILLPEAGSLSEALASIAYRGSNQAEGIILTTFDVLLKNLYVYLKWPIMVLIGVAAIYFLRQIVIRKCINKKNLLSCIPYILICLYPVGWYMLAKNHSYEHAFMAYRELMITTFAGLCMLAGLIGKGERT